MTFPFLVPTNSRIPDLMGRNGQVNSNPNNQNQIRPTLSIPELQGQCHSSSSLFAGSGQMFPERFSGQNINLHPQEINTNIVPNNSCNVGVSLRESTTGTGSNIASSSNPFTRSPEELPNSINGSVSHYQGSPSRGHGEMNLTINLESLSLSLSPCPDESLAVQSGTNSPTVNTDNNTGYVVEEQVEIGSTSANTMCLPFMRSSSDFEGEFQEGESSSMGAQVEIAEQHVVTSQVNANANANSNDNVNPSPLIQIMDPSIVTRYSTVEIRQSLMAIEDGGDVEQPPLADANVDMRYIMEARVQVAMERLRFGRVLRAQDVMGLDYSNTVHMIEDATTVEEELEEIMGAMLGLPEKTIIKYIKHENFVLEDKETQEMCCICQEEYVNGDEVGKLDCEHSFHIECIKQWLKQKNECPICRQMALLSNYEGDDNNDDQQIPFMELVSM